MTIVLIAVIVVLAGILLALGLRHRLKAGGTSVTPPASEDRPETGADAIQITDWALLVQRIHDGDSAAIADTVASDCPTS